MSDEVKTSHVTDFLKFSIGLSLGLYSVDEAGYVVTGDGERFAIQDNAPLILYQEKVTDAAAHILNPFSEGIKESDAHIWFYKMLRVGLTVRVVTLMKSIVEFAVEEQRQAAMSAADKKKAKIEPLHLPPVLSHLVSTIVQHVDAKTIAEVEALNKHTKQPNTVNGLLYPLYVKRMLTTRLQVPIIEEGDEYEVPPGIRKGTIPVFRTLLLALFGAKTPEDMGRFTAKANEEATPKVDSWMRCLFRVYDQLNPALDALDSTISVDLSEFKRHLDRMPAYSQNARSIVAMASKARPQPTIQHNAHHGDVFQRPQHADGPSRSAGGIPAFVKSDGSWGPELPNHATSFGYTGAPMPMGPGGMAPQSWGAPPPQMGYGMPSQPVFAPMGGSVYDVPFGGQIDQTFAPAFSYPAGGGLPSGFR